MPTPTLLAILNALYKHHLRGSQIHLAIFLIIHRRGYASTKEISRNLPALTYEAIKKNLTRLLQQNLILSLRRPRHSGPPITYYALTPSGQSKLLQFLHDIDTDLSPSPPPPNHPTLPL